MPTRVVRDGVLDSERYHGVDKTARLAYLELLLCADDFGIAPLSDVFLKRHTTAFDGLGKAATDTILSALHDADLLRLYEIAGARFAFVPRFGNHPRAKKPKYPVPPDTPAFGEFWAKFEPVFADHLKKEAAKNNDLGQKMRGKRSADAQQMHANVNETETETETVIRNRVKDSAGSASTSPEKTVSRSAAQPGETVAANGVAVWEAYSAAFKLRYGTLPVRNKQVNSHLKQVAERLGAEEAPQVAAFYVRHTSNLYKAAAHATNLLVRDAEKLRLEWFTGRNVEQGHGPSFKQADISDAQRRIREMTGGRLGNGSRPDDGKTIDMEVNGGQRSGDDGSPRIG